MSHDHILVTGSSGSIGTELSNQLIDQGYRVTGVDWESNRWSDRINDRTNNLDLRDDTLPDQLPADVDLIIHLSANARVYKLIEHPDKARDNFLMTFNILEYAREIVADLIFVSSREVYGNHKKIIHDETDTFVDECESPYTASKVGGEAMASSYANCYHIHTSVIRFSNVYGRYDVSDRVVPLFIAQAVHDQPLTVYGGNKILDFTYIDDCVRGVLAVINNFRKARGTTFNIASGEGSSLVDVAQIVCDTADSNSSIEIDETRTGEVSRFIADTTKARRILGHDSKYSLQQGIQKTVEWYDEQDLYDEILDLDGW
jgi:UDP-glucose 4-epimerase